MSVKYTFSGHESFPCRSLWLKKGYDFIKASNDFNSPDAVVRLGVGKNMVSSIRYWMKVFGLYENENLTALASYIFDTENGKDQFIEDLGTLWLLHYSLVSRNEANLYNLLFVRLQKERHIFDRQQVILFVKRYLTEENKPNCFNENTVRQDVGTLIQSYLLPEKPKSSEDYAPLLMDLDLICTLSESGNYQFNTDGKRLIPWQIFLFAIICHKGNDASVSYDMLQDIGLIFCMTDIEVIEM